MSLLDTLRKGFGFVLLSMGVSRPAPKAKAEQPSNAEADTHRGDGTPTRPGASG